MLGGTNDHLHHEAGDPDTSNTFADDDKFVPPSICLCQPTEITAHVRQRWDVRKHFVDDQKLILGDTGWYPGALGFRFTFETKSSNVDRYVQLSSVPQAQLLYVEYRGLPRKKRSEKQKVT